MTYTNKENEALAAFHGCIEHLIILHNDLDSFLAKNGEDSTKYNSDQIIEFELRISLYFSYFHICLEHKTRTKMMSALLKGYPETHEYLEQFDLDLFEKLQKYRNKTFHENVDLSADTRVKVQLDIKNRFLKLDGEVIKFLDVWDFEQTESKSI